jgi:acetyltransferase
MGNAVPDDVEQVMLGFGAILMRPLRPSDRAAYWQFLCRLDPEDMRMRMGRLIRADRGLCDRLLHFDRRREEAFVALDAGGAVLGVGRIVLDADGEIAVIVRSDMKHRGIGEALLDRLLRFARTKGLAEICGYVMHENRPMLSLARKHGGRFVDAPLSSLVELRFPTGYAGTGAVQPSGASRKDLTAANCTGVK